jgi:hypothetical protein
MNHEKLKRKALERTARICGQMLTVQKSAGGGGLSPNLSPLIYETCLSLEMAVAVARRNARVNKKQAKMLRKATKAAGQIGTLRADVESMQHRVTDFDPGQWKLSLERAADSVATGLNGHHFGTEGPNDLR